MENVLSWVWPTLHYMYVASCTGACYAQTFESSPSLTFALPPPIDGRPSRRASRTRAAAASGRRRESARQCWKSCISSSHCLWCQSDVSFEKSAQSAYFFEFLTAFIVLTIFDQNWKTSLNSSRRCKWSGWLAVDEAVKKPIKLNACVKAAGGQFKFLVNR